MKLPAARCIGAAIAASAATVASGSPAQKLTVRKKDVRSSLVMVAALLGRRRPYYMRFCAGCECATRSPLWQAFGLDLATQCCDVTKVASCGLLTRYPRHQ